MDEPIDIEEVFRERKDWAERTIKPISTSETKQLLDAMFENNVTHPWFERFSAFLKTHDGEEILNGELPNKYAFLYVPNANKGIWFKFTSTLEVIGPIGSKGLAILSDITKK